MAISTVQVMIDGVTHNLSLNLATGNYEKTITAPAETSYNNNIGHYFPVTVKATDSAGNYTVINDTDASFGSKLHLRVKETVLPVIIITNPTDEEITSNALPTVNWTVTDSGSGVNAETIGITIDSGNKITAGITNTAITNGYQCSYAIGDRLSDGSHTIKIDSDDFDGNSATQRAVSFVVDTVPPELSVSSPANNLVTNNNKITVAGSTKDVTSGPCKVSVKVNTGSPLLAEVNDEGSFSIEIILSEGANTIVITSTDLGGISSSVTRIATLDTKYPVVEDVSISPNPVSTGEILNITVSVSD